MASNISTVPEWTRVFVVLVAVALFAGSVVGVWFGNLPALYVVGPSAFVAWGAVRCSFGLAVKSKRAWSLDRVPVASRKKGSRQR